MGMDGNGPGDDKAMSKPIDVRSRPPTFRLHRPFAANLSIFFFFLPLDEFYPLDATIFAKFHHQRGELYLDYIWSAIDICHDGLESRLGFIVIRSLLLELLLLLGRVSIVDCSKWHLFMNFLSLDG